MKAGQEVEDADKVIPWDPAPEGRIFFEGGGGVDSGFMKLADLLETLQKAGVKASPTGFRTKNTSGQWTFERTDGKLGFILNGPADEPSPPKKRRISGSSSSNKVKPNKFGSLLELSSLVGSRSVMTTFHLQYVPKGRTAELRPTHPSATLRGSLALQPGTLSRIL